MSASDLVGEMLHGQQSYEAAMLGRIAGGQKIKVDYAPTASTQIDVATPAAL